MRKFFSFQIIGYISLLIVVVILNIALKYGDDASQYRYFLKLIVPVLILHYFFKNLKNYKGEKAVWVVSGIILFFLGDLFFLDRYSDFSFSMAIALLIFAKICFIVRFLNHEDFKIKRIIPFFVFCILYTLLIFTAIINNLKDIYFVQVLAYLFVTLMFGLFTYLRYRVVNRLSFFLVLIGYLLILVSDGLTALNMFTPGFQYNFFSSTIIALAFNLSQLFIVMGLIKETPDIS